MKIAQGRQGEALTVVAIEQRTDLRGKNGCDGLTVEREEKPKA